MAKKKHKNLAATFLVVAGLVFAGAWHTATAGAAMHPCRNWDHSTLTTAKLQAALRKYPQCKAAWAKLLNASGPNADVSKFIVSGPETPFSSKPQINSGVPDSNAGFTYYKWNPKPGDKKCHITNTATGMTGSAKCDCLNAAGEGPTQGLPTMITLVAWAEAKATASADVKVRVRTECPGSTTTVTVWVKVYASSKAKALAKARIEQRKANAGHPSAKVWSQAVATARATVHISVVTTCKVVPVPTVPTPTPQAPPTAQFMKWWQAADGSFPIGNAVTVNDVRNGQVVNSFTIYSGNSSNMNWTTLPAYVGAQVGDVFCEVIPPGMILAHPDQYPQCQQFQYSGQHFQYWNKFPPGGGCTGSSCGGGGCQTSCGGCQHNCGSTCADHPSSPDCTKDGTQGAGGNGGNDGGDSGGSGSGGQGDPPDNTGQICYKDDGTVGNIGSNGKCK